MKFNIYYILLLSVVIKWHALVNYCVYGTAYEVNVRRLYHALSDNASFVTRSQYCTEIVLSQYCHAACKIRYGA